MKEVLCFQKRVKGLATDVFYSREATGKDDKQMFLFFGQRILSVEIFILLLKNPKRDHTQPHQRVNSRLNR